MIWYVYRPLVFIVRSLFFWVPQLRERKTFEMKNLGDTLCTSFASSGLEADVCFEFSSEGEYQQVASIIDDGLGRGLRFELVLFSASVEKIIMDLAAKYPSQIRYLRYPLVSFSHSHSFTTWITAKTLVLVRYDLFPEFLAWASNPRHRLKIIWVTFKKERVKGKSPSFMKKLFLARARDLVFATKLDQDYAKLHQWKGSAYDFRMEQIRRRVEKRDQKFQRVFPNYSRIQEMLLNYPRHRRLIFANCWISDLMLLETLPQDMFVIIVPHKLDQETLNAYEQHLIQIGRQPLIVSAETAINPLSNTIILNMKGVLCELYADFGKSYVGGGFGASIHSILEPLVSGCEQISCGPKHLRSTEFDHGIALGDLHEINSAKDFSRWLTTMPLEKKKTRLSSIFQHYEQAREDVLSC
jgi:hypothetical protein